MTIESYRIVSVDFLAAQHKNISVMRFSHITMNEL